jgi:hypothetical protein
MIDRVISNMVLKFTEKKQIMKLKVM